MRQILLSVWVMTALAIATLEGLSTWLAESGRLGELLSPGSHTSLLSVASGVLFIGLRLVVIVIVPGTLAASVVLWFRPAGATTHT